MPLILLRSVCYIVFSVAAVFFAANLVFTARGHTLGDVSLVRTTGLLVMFLVLYMSKVDKQYLVKSVPLRVIGFVAAVTGLGAVFWR